MTSFKIMRTLKLSGNFKTHSHSEVQTAYAFHRNSQPPASRVLPGTYFYIFFASCSLTLFHYDQVQNTQVGINNATTNRFAFSLSSSSGAVAGVALAEQKADTSMSQDTLLHGEALFVIAATDADNIALQKHRNTLLSCSRISYFKAKW